MKQAGRPAKDANSQHHVTQLTNGGIGQYLLDVRCDHGDRRCQKQRDAAGVSDRQQNFLDKHREKASCQIHASGDHRGGMHQSRHRSRTFHRIRQPRLQRELSTLADAAGEYSQADDDHQVVRNLSVAVFVREDVSVSVCNQYVARELVASKVARFVTMHHAEETLVNLSGIVHRVTKAERAEECPQHHQPDQETKVPDTVHDERFVGSVAGRFAFGVEADQQIAADADQFPEDKHLENIARQDQPQHRKAEQRHKRKEAVEASGTMNVTAVRCVSRMVDVFIRQLITHVSNREQVNARGDQRHHREHHQRQAVDVVVECYFQRPKNAQSVNRPRIDSLASLKFFSMISRFMAVTGVMARMTCFIFCRLL